LIEGEKKKEAGRRRLVWEVIGFVGIYNRMGFSFYISQERNYEWLTYHSLHALHASYHI